MYAVPLLVILSHHLVSLLILLSRNFDSTGAHERRWAVLSDLTQSPSMSTHVKVVINEQLELDTATMTVASMNLLFPNSQEDPVLDDTDQMWRVVSACVLRLHAETAKTDPASALPANCVIRTDVEGSLGIEFISVNLLGTLFLGNIPLYDRFMACIAKKGLRKELKEQIGLHINNAQRQSKQVMIRRMSLIVNMLDEGTSIPASLMKLTGPKKRRAAPADDICKNELRRYFIANEAEKWTTRVRNGKLNDLLSIPTFSHLNKAQLKRLYKMYESEKATRTQFGKKMSDATNEMRSENSDFSISVIYALLIDWEFQFRNLHRGIHFMPAELRSFCLRCSLAHSKHLDGLPDNLSLADKSRVESFRKLILFCHLPMLQQLWDKFKNMEETSANFMNGDPSEIIAKMTLDLEHQMRLAVSNPQSRLRQLFEGQTFVREAVVQIDPALLYPEVKHYSPPDVNVEFFHFPPDWMYAAVHEQKRDPLISMLLMSFTLLFYTYYKKCLIINDVRVLSRGGRPRDADVSEDSKDVSEYLSDPESESDDDDEDDDDTDASAATATAKRAGKGTAETASRTSSSSSSRAANNDMQQNASTITAAASTTTAALAGGRKPSDMSSMTLDSGRFSSGAQEVLYRIAGASVYAAICLLGGSAGQTPLHRLIIAELLALLTVSEAEAKQQRLPDRRVSRIEYKPGVCTRPSEEVWQVVLTMEMDFIQPILDNKRLIALLNKELLQFVWGKIQNHPGAKTMRRLIREAFHNAKEISPQLFSNLSEDAIETVISDINKKFFDFYCGASVVDCFKKILENTAYDRLREKIGFRMKVLVGIMDSNTT